MHFLKRLHRLVGLDLLGALLCASVLAYVCLHTPSVRREEATKLAFRRSLSAEQMQAQTVMVMTDHGEGSGVVIHRGDKTFVWTAAHVVRHVSDVVVQQRFRFNGVQAGFQSFKGRVICRLPDTDAALLWVDAPPDRLVGAEWCGASLGPGSPVFAVGNILGHNFDDSITEGIVSQVGVSPTELDGWPWRTVDQATVAAIPGVSGGPLFSDAGKIAGIVVGGPNRPGVACYIPLRVIYAAAQEANVTWAIYGQHAPPDKVLKEAVVSATEPPEPDGLLKLLIGALPPVPDHPAPAKPTKPVKSPKSK